MPADEVPEPDEARGRRGRGAPEDEAGGHGDLRGHLGRDVGGTTSEGTSDEGRRRAPRRTSPRGRAGARGGDRPAACSTSSPTAAASCASTRRATRATTCTSHPPRSAAASCARATSVSGPLRPPRRNERHPSLIHVATVNGADAEPPEERPWFGDLTAVFPSARLAGPPRSRKLPFGRGSRVAIAGPPGAGASTLLRELAGALAQAGGHRRAGRARGRAARGGRRVARRRARRGGRQLRPLAGGADPGRRAGGRARQAPVERGGHAAVVVDSLDALPGSARRRVFGAARATEEGGTLTVIAATGDVSRCPPLGHHAHRARARAASSRLAQRHAARATP